MWVQFLGQEDLLEKEMQPTSVFLPGESHGQRSLEAMDYRVAKELYTLVAGLCAWGPGVGSPDLSAAAGLSTGDASTGSD